MRLGRSPTARNPARRSVGPRLPARRAEDQQHQRSDDGADAEREDQVERRLGHGEEPQQGEDGDAPPQRPPPSPRHPRRGHGDDRGGRGEHGRAGVRRAAEQVALVADLVERVGEPPIDHEGVGDHHEHVREATGEHQQERHTPPTAQDEDHHRDGGDEAGHELGQAEHERLERVGQAVEGLDEVLLDALHRLLGDDGDEDADEDQADADDRGGPCPRARRPAGRAAGRRAPPRRRRSARPVLRHRPPEAACRRRARAPSPGNLLEHRVLTRPGAGDKWAPHRPRGEYE